jgi:hypothetical protein
MGSLDTNDYTLTEAQKAHFLEHGWIKLESCFTVEQANTFTAPMWKRLGYSPTDKSTWTKDRTNMAYHSHIAADEFAPKAWSAICQLLAPEGGTVKDGDDRIGDRLKDGAVRRAWSDGFIVNLGTPESEKKDLSTIDEGKRLRNAGVWHVDGDFFVHYCKKSTLTSNAKFSSPLKRGQFANPFPT